MAAGGNATRPETLNGRLPLEDGSDRRETLPKRVSGDSRRFIFRSRKNEKKLRTLKVRLPPRMIPISLKLGQNAFQTIPDISFFDATKRISAFFFEKLSSVRS